MKTRILNYKFLLCAIVLCGLLASPLLDIAQAQAGGQASLCREKKPAVYLVGSTDNFAGVEPATLSPALNAFFVGKNLPRRNFDDGGIDRGFGQSFQINPCKICAATLEIKVRNEDPKGLAGNDALHVGIAPFTTNFASLNPIWSSAGQVKTLSLPAAALNSYIMNSATGQWWLDVYVQDDTAVDYIKLTVWYY